MIKIVKFDWRDGHEACTAYGLRGCTLRFILGGRMRIDNFPIPYCFEIQQRIIKIDMQEIRDVLNNLSYRCGSVRDVMQRMEAELERWHKGLCEVLLK